MVATDLDPRFTFDNFVVGPANRLAAAAARRVADAPGTSYNPLFIYSSSGLGKSHILNGIAHYSARVHPGFGVMYVTVESFLNELTAAIQAGAEQELRERYDELHIFLLDDVQFFTGQKEAQEILLRLLDGMNKSGGQVVLASDRPPAEINGLDERLLTRFSGGLIVDIAVPEYETKVAILRKKAEERDQTFEPGVAEALAKHAFTSVRELAGALNKILAIQELEERQVEANEGEALAGLQEEAQSEGPIDGLLSQAVAHNVEREEEPWGVVRDRTRSAAGRPPFPIGGAQRGEGGGALEEAAPGNAGDLREGRVLRHAPTPTTRIRRASPGPPSGGRPISQRYRPTPSG